MSDGYPLTSKYVRARKARACNFCDDAIDRGALYARAAFVLYTPSRVASIAAHVACYEILMRSTDGYYDVEWSDFVEKRLPGFTRSELEFLTPEEGDGWYSSVGEDWARVRPLCVGKK